MSLRSELLLAMAYPLLVAIVSLAVPLAINVHDRVENEVRDRAGARTAILAATAADHGEAGERLDLQSIADSGSRSARGRVLIVDGRGRLLADSARSAPRGTSFRRRVEIARALRGRRVQIVRHSQTLGQDILATAVPIIHDGRPDGAVRVTQSMEAVSKATRRSTIGISALAALVLALALIGAVVLSGRLARPTKELGAAAAAVAGGDLDTRVEPSGSTEHRHLAVAFNDMTGRVKEMVDSQQRFVADASHQLRTPLTGTRLHIEQVDTAADLDEARASAHVALVEIDRLARTVDELLVLSSGEVSEAERTTFGLGDLAEDAEARWIGTAAGADRTLTLETESAAHVTASRADIERALDSLIENAIAYGEPGGEVVVRAAGRALTVLDDGPGLGPDDDRVFDRFARGSAASRASGSGLGLAIARELARRNGADVRLEPRSDRQGTTATITFDG